MSLTLPVEIALGNIDNASKDIAKFSKSASSSLASLETAFLGLGAIISAVFVGKGFSDIVNSAVESEQAILALNTSLKLSGDFSEQASKSFQSLASEIQKTANIEDETTLKLIAQAKALGFTNDETTRLTKASVDVAAVLGTDVNTAFSDLSRTMSGQLSRSLTQRFPELRNLSKEALINGEAVRILQDKYAGAAAELNQSFGGAAKGIGIAFGLILGGIGKIVTGNPIIVSAMNQLKNILFGIAETISNNVGPAISFINGLFATVGGFILGVIGSNSKLIASFADIASTLMTIGGAIIEAVVVPALQSLLEIIKKVQEIVGPILTVAFEALSQALKVVAVGVLTVVKALAQLRGNTDQVDKLNAEIEKLVASTFNQNKALDANAEAIDSGIASSKKYIDSLSKTQEQQSKLTNATIKGSSARKQALKEELNLIEAQIKSQQAQIVSGFAQSPLKAIQDLPKNLSDLQSKGASKKQIEETKQGAKVATALNTFGEVLKGPSGAAALISQAIGALGDTVIPGIGGIVGQIAGVFAQGPAAASGFVTGFINSIPTIIDNIILSIPAVIEALSNGLITLPQQIADGLAANLPTVLNQLAAQMPAIAVRFSIALAAQSPFIAVQFATSFVRDGVPAIVKGFLDEIKKQAASAGNILGIGGGGGGILGGIAGGVGKIGKVFGFADGGTPLFGGGDNMLAGFNAKELVVDKTDTARLGRFLDQQNSGQGLAAIANKLDRLAGGGQGRPGPISVSLQLGRKELASAIFDLKADGFRV